MRCAAIVSIRRALRLFVSLPVPKARGYTSFRIETPTGRILAFPGSAALTDRAAGGHQSKKGIPAFCPFAKGSQPTGSIKAGGQQSSTESEFVDGIVDAVCHPGSELGIRCNAALREHHGITSGTVRTIRISKGDGSRLDVRSPSVAADLGLPGCRVPRPLPRASGLRQRLYCPEKPQTDPRHCPVKGDPFGRDALR